MVPLAVQLLSAPLLANTGYELGMIIGVTISVIVCAAIPLTTGAARGHVVIGIIFALLTVPVAALGCIAGLPVAIVFATIIKFLPAPNRPLLAQAEVEQEMRKIRGY